MPGLPPGSLIKTWPAFMARSKVLEVFNHPWGQFYFTLGRGKPAKAVQQLWYTHRGEIIGYFEIHEIVRNLGDNLPKLHSITGEVSEWQIKLMNYVAVCNPPFHPAPERAYMDSFRGWHYFNWDEHLSLPYSKVRL
jgi:hypothetical protein